MERLTAKHYKANDGYYMLGDTYDLDRLRELVDADKEGRVKIIPEYVGKACGSCGHFLRIKGTHRGKCAVRPLISGWHGRLDVPFEPIQSRKACKRYEPEKEARP